MIRSALELESTQLILPLLTQLPRGEQPLQRCPGRMMATLDLAIAALEWQASQSSSTLTNGSMANHTLPIKQDSVSC
jgi:hypothetical protein